MADLKPRRKRTKPRREIHTGFGPHRTLPDTWRFYAECDDEITQMVMVGGDGVLLIPTDEAAFLASEMPAMLIAEHLGRCAACAGWTKGATT